ncbi:unnamed protein product, partial [Rotaria sordida]
HTDYVTIESQANETLVNQEEIEHTIQRGLVETAKITNAWIITNGVNNTMNKLVGKRLREDDSANVPCFGLCSWRAAAGHGQLQTMQGESIPSTQANGEAPILEEGRARKGDRRQESSYWFPTKNSRVFKLPNGWESIIKNRQNIEDELSCELKSKVVGYDRWNKFYNNIPIVQLLLGGDFATLRTICHLLENDTWIVVVQV